MKRTKLQQQDFEISVSIKGAYKSIKVRPGETTDGIEYFNCNINDRNITQIRREKDGNWEQLWGELDPHAVDAIGAAITAKIEA